ncbi:hypothetical protein GF354_04415, partial [Candidatus Peregrinibacteria bacterium]|nr:hypothetical protein [Candidatus Peregrinibacteria bacterium]
NSLTLFSFLMGILAAVTLFENHTYFTIFIILSVILDIFDGSIAELENKTGRKKQIGWLFDRGSDRMVLILVLAGIFLHYDPILTAPILGLYILIKGWVIYENTVLKNEFEPIYMDRIALICFIFEKYEWGLYVILLSLLINIFEILLWKPKS